MIKKINHNSINIIQVNIPISIENEYQALISHLTSVSHPPLVSALLLFLIFS